MKSDKAQDGDPHQLHGGEPGCQSQTVFEIEIREELTQNGMIHGGVLASLIDSTCACAAFSLILPNGYATTIDLQVEFLKSVG